MPLAAVSSLSGSTSHPLSACHSQTPMPAFVVAKPPPGRATTELSVAPSGATAHPVQVRPGGPSPASTSKNSIDSRGPWWTTSSVCVSPSPGSR